MVVTLLLFVAIVIIYRNAKYIKKIIWIQNFTDDG